MSKGLLHNVTCPQLNMLSLLLFLKKKQFWRTSALFVGPLIPLFLDFCWYQHWVSKPGWIPSLAYFITCAQQIPQIHPWCETCWPLGSQHSSQAVLIHILVYKHWWGSSLWLTWHALYRMSYACSAKFTFLDFYFERKTSSLFTWSQQSLFPQ